MRPQPAPPLVTSEWMNSPRPLDIPDFRGRVLVIEAFQMLCPGCVANGLPQAIRVRAAFPAGQVAVVGLHTVFEHHEAQGTRAALEAFAHEYRLTFPIGIDAQGTGRLPVTMAAYAMQGTPTLVLVDRDGNRRLQRFGHFDDLTLGSHISALLSEPSSAADASREMSGAAQANSAECDDIGCLPGKNSSGVSPAHG